MGSHVHDVDNECAENKNFLLIFVFFCNDWKFLQCLKKKKKLLKNLINYAKKLSTTKEIHLLESQVCLKAAWYLSKTEDKTRWII